MKESKRKLSIAIVDDYDIFRRQFKGQLDSGEKYDICIIGEADNGATALEILRKNKTDILFTDIRMPKMDGIALLEQVKKENLCRCVVLLSEYTDFEYARKGIVLGAFDYLRKPVQREDIERLLERACEYLDSEFPREADVYKEKEIEDCIIARGSYIDELIKDFTEHYRHKTYTNLAHCALSVTEALDRVTKKTESEYGWAENVLPQFTYKDWILGAETLSEIMSKAEEYLKSVHRTILYYYPRDIAGISEKAVSYVLQHPYDKVALSDIAEICSVNYAYLSHCFKTEIKVSFIDYCTHYKMDIAKVLLRTTELNIMNIADQLHYDDYKYMGRIFKNTVGMTPSEYRRKNEG